MTLIDLIQFTDSFETPITMVDYDNRDNVIAYYDDCWALSFEQLCICKVRYMQFIDGVLYIAF